MDKTVKRMLHDHFNDALRKHNMQEELDARLIEDVNSRLQSAEVRRSFWDDVFRRER
jgi:siroheme synthase (precorrin-2 oxidase/ferrochelatase)